MPISTLPTPPTREDPVNFADRADTFLAALPTFANEANQLATEVNANTNAASVSATNAQASAIAAGAAAGVVLWNSATTYSVGQVVYSPTTFFTYRRKVAGQTATDPASDTTNWVQAAGTGNVSTTSVNVDLTGNRFSTVGVVGVGTAAPQVKLHVVSASTDTLRLESTNSSSVLSFKTSTTGTNPYVSATGDNLAINTSSVDRYVISSAGVHSFLLPGGGVPSVEISSLGDNPQMIFRRWSGTASDYHKVEFSLSGNGDLSLNTGFTGQPTYNRAVFYANGAVTIGSGVPYDAGNLSTNLGLKQLSPDGNTVSQFTINNGGNLYVSSYKATGSTITFNTSNSSGSVIERVILDSNGNVGVGTSSPTAQLDIASNGIRVRTTRTPASATAAGNIGDICWDTNFVYVCVATNTWKRTTLSTW